MHEKSGIGVCRSVIAHIKRVENTQKKREKGEINHRKTVLLVMSSPDSPEVDCSGIGCT
jgi:hypothetical protein